MACILRNIKHKYIRFCSTVSQMHVEYEEYGNPRKVLHLKSERVSSEKYEPKELLIRFMASPINPADINTIQGVYPIKPPFPAVGGSEGVAIVIDPMHSTKFKEGDWVLPNKAGFGTWSTDVFCSEKDVFGIPKDIPLVSAATLAVNPCTAYRMLHDFVKLSPGDVIIQNGANGNVGRAVIQIAADMGIQTINIVRKREDAHDIVSDLLSIGATHVIQDTPDDEELKIVKEHMPAPKIALNCVGGNSVIKLAKYLGKNGILVTYGGMSKRPLVVPTGSLIFNDIKLTGFWMTRWNGENRDSPEKTKMWDCLIDLVRSGKLKKPKHKLVPIQDFEQAIEQAMSENNNTKQILVTCMSYLAEYVEDLKYDYT